MEDLRYEKKSGYKTIWGMDGSARDTSFLGYEDQEYQKRFAVSNNVSRNLYDNIESLSNNLYSVVLKGIENGR